MTFALGLMIGFLASVPAILLILWAALKVQDARDAERDWATLSAHDWATLSLWEIP